MTYIRTIKIDIIMKKIFFSILFLCSFVVFSQSDVIYKMNGETLEVQVKEINESSIVFSYPGETFSNTIGKSSVSKIIFSSGRVEEFASSLNVASVKSCKDWQKVQISNIDSEVKGLSKIDIINAKAKGVTSYSSIVKLQDRVYNKIKTETAMMGGNVAYLIEQNSEDSRTGFGSSQAPSVSVSGLAYTSKKVFINEIHEGDYKVSEAFELKANEYEMKSIKVSSQKISIVKSAIATDNGFHKIDVSIKAVSDVKKFTIIYADDKELVLSGIKSTKKGKKTFFNVILTK